jgi:signal transduction histidine kinase
MTVTILLGENIHIIERLLGQMRDISLVLRPSLLDDLGLTAALQSFVQRLARRSEPEIHLVADPTLGRCDPDVETACYRVAQEALSNAVRHAQARRIRVELAARGDHLRLVVADGGVGFDVASATAKSAGESLGLQSMAERATLVGGRVEINSGPGGNTELLALFPLHGSSPPSMVRTAGSD